MSGADDMDIEAMKARIKAKRAAKAAAAGGVSASPRAEFPKPWAPKPLPPLLTDVPPGYLVDKAVGHFAAAVPGHKKERAGRAYHRKSRVVAGLEEALDDGADNESGASDSETPSGTKISADDEFDFLSSPRANNAKKGEALYEVMGLGERRWNATDDDIREAYRKLCLKYHPDKLGRLETEGEVEAATAKFRAIQEAYETLSDKAKRRVYDSSDSFDDRIPPEELPAGANFYDTYSPVFLRNSRWSIVRGPPQLGDASTPMSEVDEFYDFWFSFKSWREFEHDTDEFDLDQAEMREEKRWMQRQIEKQKKELKNKENRRVAKLVERAYKTDPRVITAKAVEKARKEQERRDKAEARKRREEEALAKIRAVEEAAAIAEEKAAQEKQNAKKAREKEKNALRNARRKLRKMCDSNEFILEDEDLMGASATSPRIFHQQDKTVASYTIVPGLKLAWCLLLAVSR